MQSLNAFSSSVIWTCQHCAQTCILCYDHDKNWPIGKGRAEEKEVLHKTETNCYIKICIFASPSSHKFASSLGRRV